MFSGKIRCRIAAAVAAAVAAIAWSGSACAQLPHIEMPANLIGVIDFRLVLTDGERSWADGGFGKSRFGGGGDDVDGHAVPATAEIVWHGPLTWNLGGTLAVAAQDEQDQPIDLIEGFVTWRPLPNGETRFSARAGLFWPPVSLEHEGPEWRVADMITPSAINSWIGEEVKVAGVEGSVSHPLAGGRVTGTLGLFGLNDTSGTLLAFRGWALHDQKTGAFSRQALPPPNAFIAMVQPQWTTPALEVDGRPGFYGRIAWQMAAPVMLEGFYYQNRGDPEAATPDMQWGWDTRFWNIGARIDIGPHTRILAQALTGTTEMGFVENGAIWVDTRYRSAYLRLTQELGRVAVSGRADLFDTRQRGSQLTAEDDEEGWALTGAVDWRLSDQADLIFEYMHLDSQRAARARAGEDADQAQNVVQVAMRIRL